MPENLLQEITTLYNSRSFGAAKELTEKGLQNDATNAALHNVLGALNNSLGDQETAIQCYKKALALDPQYFEALNNLGTVYSALNQDDLARQCFTQVLDRKPQYHMALLNLGNLEMKAGQETAAEELYLRAIAAKPDYPEANNNLGNIYNSKGEVAAARGCFEKALAVRPNYPDALLNLAKILIVEGALTKASRVLTRLLKLEPNNFKAWNELGKAYRELNKNAEAAAIFKKSLNIDSNNTRTLQLLAGTLHSLGNIDPALKCLEKALQLKPESSKIHQDYCSILEQTHRKEKYRFAVSAARKHCSAEDPHMQMIEARYYINEGELAAASKLLTAIAPDLLENTAQISRAESLGKIADKLGQHEAAFIHFQQANEILRQEPSTARFDGRFRSRLDRLEKLYTSKWVDSWTRPAIDDDLPTPVFLIGFPRSGTTLLDNILHSHSQISVVEEQPVVQNMIEFLGGAQRDISSLSQQEILDARASYWKDLRTHLNKDDNVSTVVDKLPFHSVNAGHIYRIFPEAKFILALRHPCDCVLSCFMQAFRLNEAMAELLSMEGAAEIYDKTMSLWLRYNELLPLNSHRVYYEKLIDSVESQIDPLLNFLGLEWEENLLNFSDTARSRQSINTPSYNQVTQPLYSSARGRWENYASQMNEVLPGLLQWAEHWNYERPEIALPD
jgi:tetratricopeptide (TPR) repeat protein